MAEEKKFDINKITQQIKQHLNVRNIALAVAALTLVAILGTILLKNVSKEDYAVLYTGLSPDDAGQILTVLQEENIPYKVEGNGTIILVPKNKVYDIRLKLAAKGIPSGKSVGFELFEEPKMGTTQFQEQVNFLRAIEGELERTIKQIDAVMDAKVNIALPKDSIFVREEDEAKASVLIKLYPGKDLTKEQVKAIVFLVSNAVPKLKPENVSVIDNRGRVLSDLIDNEEEIVSDKNLEIKRKLEKQIERSVYSMLAKALGPDKVVVKATVELETGKQLKQDEIYDPDKTAVVSERKIQEKETSYAKQQAGVPGTTTNVPPVVDITGTGNIQTKKERKDQTKNYDVSKSLIKTEKQIFKIKKISVGVLIDGKYVEEKDENGNVVKKFVPRSQEEIKLYEELVKGAIGFNPERGDQVKVASVPFEAPPQIEIAEEGLTPKNLILLGAIGILSLVIILLLIAVILKMKKSKKEEAIATATIQAGAEGISGMEALHKIEESMGLESEPVYQKILEIAEKNPELIADLISKWLKEEGK